MEVEPGVVPVCVAVFGERAFSTSLVEASGTASSSTSVFTASLIFVYISAVSTSYLLSVPSDSRALRRFTLRSCALNIWAFPSRIERTRWPWACRGLAVSPCPSRTRAIPSLVLVTAVVIFDL